MDVKLNVARPSGEIKEISLRKPVTVLGRGADCDLRIPIEGCSRKHCEIRLENDRVFVKDLDSSNGTYINNEKIAEAEIEPGDALAIGPVIIRFRINGEPDELPPLPPTMVPGSSDEYEEEELEEVYEEDEDYDEDNEETVDTVSEEFEDDEAEEDEEEYEVEYEDEDEDVEEEEEIEIEEDEDEDEDEDDPFAALAKESSGGGDALDALAAASRGGDDDAFSALDALAGASKDKDKDKDKKKKKKKKDEDD